MFDDFFAYTTSLDFIVMTIVTPFQLSQMLLYLLDHIIYSLMISTQLLYWFP
jgi:hypothetical protein